jgi:hypothetical protein
MDFHENWPKNLSLKPLESLIYRPKKPKKLRKFFKLNMVMWGIKKFLF